MNSPGETVSAFGLNNQGHVVGWTHASGPDVGWLWTPANGLRTLRELFDFPAAGISSPKPRDINDAGQILIHGYDNAAGEWRTLLLTPIPTVIPGDMKCDDLLNGADIDPFFLALGEPAVYAAQFPNCDPLNGDINRDGALNGGDIDPFFQCLGRNCP